MRKEDFFKPNLKIQGGRGRFRRGMTLVEVLAAAVIIAVSLIGMVSTWAYMVQGTISTDERAAAYECARSVLERARSCGFNATLQRTTSNPSASDASPNTSTSDSSAAPYRYYDGNGLEVDADNYTPLTSMPANARFFVQTSVVFSGGYPAAYADHQLMTITVTVQRIDDQGNLQPDIIAKLQTCLTQGGV